MKTTKRMRSVQGKPVGIYHSEFRKLFMCASLHLEAATMLWIRTTLPPIVQSSIVHLALFNNGCC